MRSLSPTLVAAQQAASATPFVQVTVSDRIGDVARLRWERLYSGAEPDKYHAATVPGDGSLLRVRVTGAGQPLAYQRVTSPGPGSNFAMWSSLDAAADAGVALAASGPNIALAFVAPIGSSLRVRESADYGATFGAAVTAAGESGAISWVAAARKNDGTVLLVYSLGGVVKTVKRVSGVWGAPAAWPYNASAISGLAVTHAGDYHLAIAGVDSSGRAKLWTAVYGDGFGQAADTWSPLLELAAAESGSDVTFRAPSLAALDTHRLFFVERYTGSVAYTRLQWTWFAPTHAFAANAWREPLPFDDDTVFGLAISGNASFAWLSAPDGVWRASIQPPTLDVSDDVLELVSETRRDGAAVRVVLRNDDGRYNDLSNSAMRLGAELTVSPGYVTSAGPEVSPGPRYRIDGWEHISAGGEATLTLIASDGWSVLRHWHARRQYVWAAGSAAVGEILLFVLGRAGIELVDIGGSAVITSQRPAFTIHPGEDGERVVQRLLAMTPDALRIVAEFAYLFEPLATDAADYAYGTNHRIYRARYASNGLVANRAQVFGNNVLAEAFAWEEIDDLFDRLRQVHDLNVSSVGTAEDRAAAALRQETLATERGELVTPVNCGQELYDVVAVTDPQAGLLAERFRVAGITLRYLRRGPAVYEQRLRLSRV